MKIDAKCCCGAELHLESGTFINAGGSPDSNGRVFVIELRHEEWQKAHENHASMMFSKVTK